MKKNFIKSPNDYPLFGYRVFPTVKDSLTKKLDETLRQINKSLPDYKKPLKKNDIFIQAVSIGLDSLKREGKK